jgi:hypothetical protein
LGIQDIQIDQNTIYILDAVNGLFRIAMLDDGTFSVVERVQTSSGFNKLSVYSTALGNRRKIALAAEGRVLEFDWTGETPQLAYSYTVPGGALINLALSEEFVVAQVSETSPASSVYIFRSRIQSSYLKAHSALTYPFRTIISFDQKQSQLIVIETYSMVQIAVSSPILEIISNIQKYSI